MTRLTATFPYDHVLLTGGSGYIGSRLATSLTDATAVTILDRSHRTRVPGAEQLTGDVRDVSTVDSIADSVDFIYHQAAEVDISKTIANPQESASTNVLGTLTILEAARKYDLPVVIASSAAVYGHAETIPTPESSVLNPTSPYGLEKMAADHYASLYTELYGLDVLSLRYFNVYGPGERSHPGVVRTFISQSQQGEPITIHGDGTQTRDFIHIDDVVRANLLAATGPFDGRSYNIGTGTPISIRTLAETIRSFVDPSLEIQTRERPRGDIQDSCANIDRASKALGFRPMISLPNGIKQFVSIPA